MKYVDMHCDTITYLYKTGGELLKNDLHNDLQKMKKGECLLQNFAIFTNLAKEDASFTKESIAFYYEQLEKNRDLIRPVYRFSDIRDNEEQGYMNALLTLEEGAVIDDDLEQLNWYYDQGVRMITLTWNYANGIGHPNFDGKDPDYHSILYRTNDRDGLTDFGIEYVRKMNELGMIVDVSHLSEGGFYDVAKHSSKPFVATHSCARALCSHQRNLTDGQLRTLADCGGVVGINFNGPFLADDGIEIDTDAIVRHAQHMYNVAGIDALAWGSDFDGIGSEYDYLLFDEICCKMSKVFTDDQMEKINSGNFMRVFAER